MGHLQLLPGSVAVAADGLWSPEKEAVLVMKKAKLTLLLMLSLALVLLVAQNTAPVHARFLWLAAEIPVIVLLFLTAAGGFVSGLLVALLLKSGAQSKPKEGECHD